MHGVGAALYPLWEFAVLETPDERTVAIWTIVDVKEVVVWLNVETRDKKRKKAQKGGNQSERDEIEMILKMAKKNRFAGYPIKAKDRT